MNLKLNQTAKNLIALTTIFAISIFAYIYFSQYKLARLVVVIFITTFHTFWSLNQQQRYHNITRKHLLEHLFLALLTLALFSFLIYYD